MTMKLRRWSRPAIVLAVACCGLVPASAHAAATNYDIRGNWQGFLATPEATEFEHIDNLDLCTGALTGKGGGGGPGDPTWAINGTVTNGNQVTITFGPYNDIPNGYTATFTGTIGPAGGMMTGTFNDSFGTFNPVRVSGPPSTPPEGQNCGIPTPGGSVPPKSKAKLKRRIGPVVSCGIDACLAEVDGRLRIVLNGGRVLAASAKAKSFKLPHAHAELAPNTTTRVTVKVPKKVLKKARAARKAGAKVRARFTTTITSGGQTQTFKSTVRLT